MTISPSDHPLLLKEPIYFYYSSCYYNHNSSRLYNQWQVGRGHTSSWCVDIASLKHKERPKLDIAMLYPTPEESLQRPISLWDPWEGGFEGMAQAWLKFLLQFRNYDGLDFRMVGAEGKEMKKYAKYFKDLKMFLTGMEVGPSVVPFFAGSPYGDGSERYHDFMR
jgi:hypothetical protein